MLAEGTMVDSRKVERMADGNDDLADRVGKLEARMDDGFKAIDARFNAVDAQFEAVTEALVEQRQYTELAYSRLDMKMDAGFSRLEARIDSKTSRLEGKVDVGFSRLERKLDQFIDTQSQTNALVERRLKAREQRRRRP